MMPAASRRPARLSARSVREVARRMSSQMPSAERVEGIPFDETAIVQMQLKPASRMTVGGIVWRLLRVVRRERLVRFQTLTVPPAVNMGYVVHTSRVSVLAFKSFDLYCNETLITWGVSGARA